MEIPISRLATLCPSISVHMIIQNFASIKRRKKKNQIFVIRFLFNVNRNELQLAVVLKLKEN